ncbi:MAG: PAS domain-containing protein [Betaproteobacteria bacterium]
MNNNHREFPLFELDERTRQLLVLDSIQLPIWYCDRDPVYRFVNRPYADLFGGDAAEILGQRVPNVTGVAVFAEIGEHIAQALTSPDTGFCAGRNGRRRLCSDHRHR